MMQGKIELRESKKNGAAVRASEQEDPIVGSGKMSVSAVNSGALMTS